MEVTFREIWDGIFDSESGFFRWLFDRKCFARIHAKRAKRLFPKMKTKELMQFAKNADKLHEGVPVELLKEIAQRFENDT